MWNRLLHLRRDEKGMSFVYIGCGFMAFLTATTLAIDVGMFMTARSQSQNAADAGALAGATSLAFDSFTDHTPSGPAVSASISTALANKVMAGNVVVAPENVEFLTGPNGTQNRVRVSVFRDAAHAVPNSGPIPTLMGPLFGVPLFDIMAVATAEASPANAVTCVKPFMLPDRWKEASGTWDPQTSTFNAYDNKGNLLPNPDTYDGNPASTNYTGYKPERDKGIQLVIRAGTGSNIEPTMYFSWKMPGEIGGDYYRNNIAGCNTYFIPLGQPDPYYMVQEPGNMVGPTVDGILDLMAKDPNAKWAGGYPPGEGSTAECNNCMVGSKFGGHTSPRIFPIPLYDPVYYDENKANGRYADFKLANVLGFFVEKVVGNEIYGRITPILGTIDPDGGPAPVGSFATAIRLVQ